MLLMQRCCFWLSKLYRSWDDAKNNRKGYTDMLGKWIVRHWIAMCVGCVLMGIALRIAYAERGYMAFGSEWLIIPAVFVVEGCIKDYMRRRRRERLQRSKRKHGKRGVQTARR